MHQLVSVRSIDQILFHRQLDKRLLRVRFGKIENLSDLLDRHHVFANRQSGGRNHGVLLDLDQSAELLWADNTLFDEIDAKFETHALTCLKLRISFTLNCIPMGELDFPI